MSETTTRDTLTITDNRTGRTYEIPIEDGTIRAIELRQIQPGDDDFGLVTYDPAFMNTASCQSAITYIDGDAGILRYRGYPIEQLAEQSTFLEVAYLLLNGELPTAAPARRRGWTTSPTTPSSTRTSRSSSTASTTTPTRWASWSARSAALSTFYPDAKHIDDPDLRPLQIVRLIAKMPTHRRLRLPPRDRAPLRLPRQRPLVHRELPEHDVEDDRAQVPAEPDPRAGPRRAVHPPRRPRAELLAPSPCGPSAAPRPTRSRRRPRPPPPSTGRCTAAPTSRSSGCSTRSAPSTTSPTSSRR